MKPLIQGLPSTWSEIALINCFSSSVGGANILSTEYRESGVPIILKSDVQAMCAMTLPSKFVPEKVVRQKYLSRIVEKDDLLLCMRDLSQKANILGLISTCTDEQIGHLVAQGVTLLRGCKINRKYVSYFSNSKAYREYVLKVKRGSTQVHLGNDDVFQVALPLPPIGEQDRIVAKIESTDEKIGLINRRIRKAEALLAKYREALFRKAFRGDLTLQDRSDESALVLLERIRSESSSFGEKKKKSELPPILPGEIPFEVPKSWAWIRLGELAENVEYGSSSKTNDDSRAVPVLRMGNIQNGKLDITKLKYLPKSHDEFPQLYLNQGDILFNRTNSPELVGKCAVYSGELAPCSFASYLIRLSVRKSALNPVYVAAFINSSFGRQWIKSVMVQQVGQANVNGTKLKECPLPLPPLAEQNRIVDTIFLFEDRERRILASIEGIRTRLRSLSSKILTEAFAGHLVSRDIADGTGHELREKLERREQSNSVVKSKNKKRVTR